MRRIHPLDEPGCKACMAKRVDCLYPLSAAYILSTGLGCEACMAKRVGCLYPLSAAYILSTSLTCACACACEQQAC